MNAKASLLAAALAAGVAFAAPALAEMTKMVGGAPMYPSKNIIENAAHSKDHTTLVAAVKAAGLVDTLEGAGPFTVFAPTNAVFAHLPAGTVDIIDPRLGPPKSLGVIDAARRGASLAAYDRAVVEDATYAVTVEPPGGSPDGKPSGPPVFVGKLIPVGK
jgi:Fasciclin domain